MSSTGQTLRSRAEAETLRAGETEPAQQSQSLTRGAKLGRYVVLDEIGSGGMGVVYAAGDDAFELAEIEAEKAAQLWARGQRRTAYRRILEVREIYLSLESLDSKQGLVQLDRMIAKWRAQLHGRE